MPTVTPLLGRTIAKTLVGDGCWEWTGAKASTGARYGRIREAGVGSHLLAAHRVMYEAMVGPIPSGMTLDHLCCNPGCVRPKHLEPVTQAENTRRYKATVTHCPRGHEYTAVSTYINASGARSCRECRRETNRRWYGRQKEK